MTDKSSLQTSEDNTNDITAITTLQQSEEKLENNTGTNDNFAENNTLLSEPEQCSISAPHNGSVKGKLTSSAKTFLSNIFAELIGSFVIFLSIYVLYSLYSLTFVNNLFLVIMSTGMIYGLATYCFSSARISHFNPAITLAHMLMSKIRVIEGITYIAIQCIAALLAGSLLIVLQPTSQKVDTAQLTVDAANTINGNLFFHATFGNYGITVPLLTSIIMEILATFIIVTIALQYGKRNTQIHNVENLSNYRHKKLAKYSLISGIAYAFGTALTYPLTGAALNPARSTGILVSLVPISNKIVTRQDINPFQNIWIFWLCPLIGAALAVIVVIVRNMLSHSQISSDNNISQYKKDNVTNTDIDDDIEIANDNTENNTINNSIEHISPDNKIR